LGSSLTLFKPLCELGILSHNEFWQGLLGKVVERLTEKATWLQQESIAPSPNLSYEIEEDTD